MHTRMNMSCSLLQPVVRLCCSYEPLLGEIGDKVCSNRSGAIAVEDLGRILVIAALAMACQPVVYHDCM